MTHKEKLIKFMEKKQEIITSFSYEFKGLYFNDADKKAIEEWPEDTCLNIWEYIRDKIFSGITHGLSIPACPFCIYKNMEMIYCPECAYAKNHYGLSSDVDCSKDFNIITENDKIYKYLTNEVYQNIIKEIDNDS